MASRSSAGEGDDVLDLGLLIFEFWKEREFVPIYLVGKLVSDKQPKSFALIDIVMKAFRAKRKITAGTRGMDW